MNKLFLLAAFPIAALAFSSGPPDGLTGAPSQGNCTQCHGGNDLNSGDGAFGIAGPSVYEPGETYTMTLSLEDPGQSRWGFEATTLEMGDLMITDATNTQLSGGAYVKQTSAGTQNGTNDGPVTWTFDWTAPEAGSGDVIFYAAGNAADGNSGSGGDFIYTSSYTVEESTALAGSELPQNIRLLRNVPNPFNPSTELQFDLAQGGPVLLEVYDLQGRLVNTLLNSLSPAGSHSVTWDGRSAQGQPVASGVYLARMQTANEQRVHRMLLVK